MNDFFIKCSYHKYSSDILIYVLDLDMAKFINHKLTKVISDCKTLTICNDYDKTKHTFNDLLNINTKKVIICVNFGDFHFENIGLVINLVKDYDRHHKVLGYHPPNQYFTIKSENIQRRNKKIILKVYRA